MTHRQIMQALLDGKYVKAYLTAEEEESFCDIYMLSNRDGDLLVKKSYCNEFKKIIVPKLFGHLDYSSYEILDYLVDKPRLDEEERKYLTAVLKPFKNVPFDEIKIYKSNHPKEGTEWITIDLGYDMIDFPFFPQGKMYKGLEVGKEYTLEELGL